MDYWAPPPWVGAFKQVTSEPGGLARVTTAASTNSAQVSHHIGRWEPAAVLVEVEAKRRILDEHAHYPAFKGIGCGICAWDGRSGFIEDDGWCLTVRLLALPCADREGYREEWRPA